MKQDFFLSEERGALQPQPHRCPFLLLILWLLHSPPRPQALQMAAPTWHLWWGRCLPPSLPPNWLPRSCSFPLKAAWPFQDNLGQDLDPPRGPQGIFPLLNFPLPSWGHSCPSSCPSWAFEGWGNEASPLLALLPLETHFLLVLRAPSLPGSPQSSSRLSSSIGG